MSLSEVGGSFVLGPLARFKDPEGTSPCSVVKLSQLRKEEGRLRKPPAGEWLEDNCMKTVLYVNSQIKRYSYLIYHSVILAWAWFRHYWSGHYVNIMFVFMHDFDWPVTSSWGFAVNCWSNLNIDFQLFCKRREMTSSSECKVCGESFRFYNCLDKYFHYDRHYNEVKKLI